MELINLILLWTIFVSSFVLFTAASYTIFKIYQTYKSNFAYIMVLFTFAYSIQYVLIIIFQMVTNNKTQPSNIYFYSCLNYIESFLALQSWIFSTRYLESVVNCSFDKPCISKQNLIKLTYSVIFGYIIFNVVFGIWQLVSCPGLDDYDEY